MEPINSSQWRRISTYFKPYKLYLCIALIALVFFSLVDAGMIYFIKPLIDQGLTNSDAGVLKIGAYLVILIFLLRGLASFVANYLIAYISTKITFTIRQQAYNKLQLLPMSFLDTISSGGLISKIIYDTEQISGAISASLVTVIRETLIIMILLIMMFYVSWQLSLIFLIIGPAIGLIIKKVSTRFKMVSIALQNSMGEVSKATEQSITSHQDVLIFGAAKRLTEKFWFINNRNRQQTMKLATTSAASNPIIQLIASLSIAAVLLLASIDQVLSTLTAGTFTMMLFAMGSLLRPLKQLTNINQQLQKGLAAATSIFALLDQKEELDKGQKVLSGSKHNIRFEGLNFHYPNTEILALKDFSTTIPAHNTFAFVGESGSGKTTLSKLLLRLYQAPEKSIFINDIAIEQYTLASLRSQFALVSQDVVLLDDSLANNIAFGCGSNVSRADIEKAATDANVLAFAKELEWGLDSPVGENGRLLSGGQKQRVAIARAMLRNAPIVVLDEATSSLDNKSEFLIQQAFSRLSENRTLLVIAHRLSTIEKADKILVMHKGTLVEQGDHQNLLKRCGMYQSLHQQQVV
ncbi:lipid A export permease/ATP-binding protein MsbA [Paraglaciecola sp.]|uniref:lipid A export permease/ATP-binding protein MsbA n=1 Tax=Paraglaciecola sp. TaxID=1920173 RepID=UPI0030F386B6